MENLSNVPAIGSANLFVGSSLRGSSAILGVIYKEKSQSFFMVRHSRMKRVDAKRPLKMMVDGKFYTKVHGEDDYEQHLKDIDRRKHKVRLV